MTRLWSLGLLVCCCLVGLTVPESRAWRFAGSFHPVLSSDYEMRSHSNQPFVTHNQFREMPRTRHRLTRIASRRATCLDNRMQMKEKQLLEVVAPGNKRVNNGGKRGILRNGFEVNYGVGTSYCKSQPTLKRHPRIFPRW